MGPIEREVLADPATYYWLASLIKQTRERDPVDVVHAARLFLRIAQERLGTEE